jgi:hypothetical protein
MGGTMYDAAPKELQILVNNDEQSLWKFKMKSVFKNIPESYDRIFELKRIWELKYRNRKKSHQKKIDMIFGFNRTQEPRFSTSPLNILEIKSDYRGNSFPTKCLMLNDDYYKCDFTLEHLKEIDNFIYEHRRLSTLFSRTKNVQEQYENMLMLKALANKEGQWIIGTLETLGLRETLKGTKITKEWVQSLIDKEKDRLGKPLVEPYNLSEFKYKDSVKELISPLDLQMEGNMMGHCVGGYSGPIEDGNSRIFHIEVDGIGSTVQISIRKKNHNIWGQYDFTEGGEVIHNRNTPIEPQYENQFNVSQHYGRYPEKGNLRPTNKNRGIAFKLAYFLAQEHLTEKEKERIDESIKEDKKMKGVRDSVLKQERKQRPGGHHSISKNNLWSRWMSDGHSTVRRNQMFERRTGQNRHHGIENREHDELDLLEF